MHQFIEQIYKLKQGKSVAFLDRDGTLIKDIHYLYDSNQIEILPSVIEGLKLLQKHTTLMIIITNQPVVAKGLATIDEVKKINDTLISRLKKKGITIHAIYSCPHHPNADVLMYRVNCDCRKPKTAMFEKAIKTFSLNIKHAVMIGDNQRDIDAAKKLHIPACFIKGKTVPDSDNGINFICNNFLEAVKMVINHTL